MRSQTVGDHGELRDQLSRDWISYLSGRDLAPLPVPNGLDDSDRQPYTNHADALILSNGNDLGDDPVRDSTERALLQAFRREGRPILGVCRGLQFLNSAFNGTVTRDLTESTSARESHAGHPHMVRIHGQEFQKIFGAHYKVNSYHDDAVRAEDMAPDLETFATADDGALVEGLYHPDEPILGLQWHPERPLHRSEPTDRLVEHFLRGRRLW